MFYKEIGDFGIMIVICGVFLYFAKTIFDYMIKDVKRNQDEIIKKLEYGEQRRTILISGNEKLIEVLNKLENRLTTEKITGKPLETILNTKVSQICLCIKNEGINVINNNNINKNWTSIENEIDNLYDEKLLKFQKEYHDLMEFETYAEIDKQFSVELNKSKEEILAILSNLKETKELIDYRIAIRRISAAMDKTKKNLDRITNEIIN
ncbi:hypothetical protein EII29_09660 [Leptotrichia sp. OH3620_COT-345]|uniref:hypothetical protein n=1 Tax=Leptotrichia sp. OH3620_COT-345 TaxID=2491048 RepID=UPI000F655FA4|nr:hypothetical protein [Leptotrichia sp. OH3620_COT-345]RRD38781.1 hypothetical protein EII29_09660 [Leptotrichia sp. OH3620_COT-345]